jgi:hypothetical protein
MRFARYVFATAGVLGLIILIPQYFLERRIGLDQPPPLTHPEFFYGFLGIAIAWQVAFLIIASDPPRYRLLMIPAMIEKFSFVAAIFTLLALGRVAPVMAAAGLFDFTLGLLFLAGFLLTRAPLQKE